jgi:hypothetical protein
MYSTPALNARMAIDFWNQDNLCLLEDMNSWVFLSISSLSGSELIFDMVLLSSFHELVNMVAHIIEAINGIFLVYQA